jgi:hypothetical protein
MTRWPGTRRARRVSLGCVAVAALVIAGAATAGPFVGKASKARARVGDVVRVQAGAGLQFYALLPLYLVRQDLAPRAQPCTVNGQDGFCAPKEPDVPRGGIYHRIGTINVRHSNVSTITYRVPKLQPGVYVYVIYCGPCYDGPGGSVIVFDQRSTSKLTVVR